MLKFGGPRQDVPGGAAADPTAAAVPPAGTAAVLPGAQAAGGGTPDRTQRHVRLPDGRSAGPSGTSGVGAVGGGGGGVPIASFGGTGAMDPAKVGAAAIMAQQMTPPDALVQYGGAPGGAQPPLVSHLLTHCLHSQPQRMTETVRTRDC
jgi:hypothetical protein